MRQAVQLWSILERHETRQENGKAGPNQIAPAGDVVEYGGLAVYASQHYDYGSQIEGDSTICG